MRVLGIDPGSIVCGWGIIDFRNNGFSLVEYGVVKAGKTGLDFPERLKEIYLRLLKVIERTKPEAAAFETIFYSKNVQSLVKLSHARSVAILAATLNNIPIFEHSPREIKKSVTGRGNASKEQVQYMVRKLLNIEETPEFYDSTDALAAAICHALKPAGSSKNSKSWSEYLKENPGRVIKY